MLTWSTAPRPTASRADTLARCSTGNRTIEELLDTVCAFFDCDRSVRNSAKHLGVHENTIRYRLGRVLELTAP